MAYDIRFNTTVAGSSDLDKVDSIIQKLSGSTRTVSGELKVFEAALRADVAAGNSLSEALKTIASTSQGGFEGLAKLAKEAQNFSATANEAAGATVRFTTSTRELGAAHAAVVPQVAAASAAIRVFEGAMPIRAVERFAVNILGLGPLLQAAFPVVGLIAFGEMMSSTFDKFDPFTQAEKKLEDATKSLDKTFEELGRRLERLNIRKMTDEFGAAAGAMLASNYAGTGVAEKRALADSMQPQIDKARNEAARYASASPVVAGVMGAAFPGGGVVASEALKRQSAASQADLRRLTDQQAALRAEADIDQSEADKDLDDAKKDQRKTDSEAARKSAAEAKRRATAAEEKRRAQEQFRQRDLPPVEKDWEQYHEFVKRYGETGGDASQDFAAAAGRADEINNKGIIAQRNFPLTLTGSGLPAAKPYTPKATSVTGENGENDIKRFGEDVLSDLKRYNSEHYKQVNDSGAEAVRATTARGAFADKMTGLNPELSEAQKIVELNKQDLETARQKYQIELDTAAKQQTVKEQTEAKDKAELANQLELQKIQEEGEERLAELQKNRIEEFRGLIGGLFDAATSRTPRAIPNFIKDQVLHVGQTVAENAAQTYLYKPLQSLIPTTPGGGLGKLLNGTGLTKDATGAAPLAAAGTTLNSAGLQLQAAAKALAMSRTGGGGGSVSSSGGGVPTWNPSTSTFTGGSSPDAGGSSWDIYSQAGVNPNYTGTQMVANPGSTLMTGPTPQSTFSSDASLAMTSAGLAGAAVMAGLDFSKGGASKDLQGAGIVAGVAGSVTKLVTTAMDIASPLLSAIPVVGAIAAMALPLIGSFFNGPQQRANSINTELGKAAYVAPQALNVTQDSSGNFTDFDARGNIRTSNFSAVPTVRQGSTWEQTHGLFDGPPTFYNVPGGQTSQFGAATPAPSTVIHVNAIDTQSGLDFLNKNSAAVGGAAAKALQNAHASFTAEVQRAANP